MELNLGSSVLGKGAPGTGVHWFHGYKAEEENVCMDRTHECKRIVDSSTRSIYQVSIIVLPLRCLYFFLETMRDSALGTDMYKTVNILIVIADVSHTETRWIIQVHSPGGSGEPLLEMGTAHGKADNYS